MLHTSIMTLQFPPSWSINSLVLYLNFFENAKLQPKQVNLIWKTFYKSQKYLITQLLTSLAYTGYSKVQSHDPSSLNWW